MNCPICNTQCPDGTRFCTLCGSLLSQDAPTPVVSEWSVDDILNSYEPDTPAAPQRSSTPPVRRAPNPRRRKQEKTSPLIWLIPLVILLIGAIFVLIDPAPTAEDYEKLVRSGYLGEYTDISVEDLLDGHYRDVLGYGKGKWACSQNKNGQWVVEVHYEAVDEARKEVVIQFTALDEASFSITDYMDPGEHLEQENDLLHLLNSMYFTAYGVANPEVSTDPEVLEKLVKRLDKISASAVVYGSSGDYKEERSEICKKAGKKLSEVSAAVLLELKQS